MYNNGTKRQRLGLDLPNVLDQLLISVKPVSGSRSRWPVSGPSGNGPLAEEMVRTLQDIQAGSTRRDAYRAMAARSSVQDLKSFVSAVIQADVQGLSVARVLKPQADQMRIKRRLRAEEKAMKLPVAVVFPLLLFIFPPLFIVILGPAVINAIATFLIEAPAPGPKAIYRNRPQLVGAGGNITHQIEGAADVQAQGHSAWTGWGSSRSAARRPLNSR